MKHQIALIGGQLLPIYIGLKEFDPDKIHFIVSSESRHRTSFLKPYLQNKSFSEYICNAFDFFEVKAKFEAIINSLSPSDDLCFNLTGGTKIMVLAAQSLIHERNLSGFYINQDNSFLELPSYQKHKLKSSISIEDFFNLSGHVIDNGYMINDLPPEDFNISHQIYSFCLSSYRYKAIVTHFSKLFRDINQMPISGSEQVKNMLVTWSKNSVTVKENNHQIFRARSLRIHNLFFNSGWWEFLVAKEAASWNMAKELFLQCTLPFRNDNKNLKNEIDVLINVGYKLIFIECKSGKVKQEDINKMRIIKDVYGGTVSKSILVSLELPLPSIIEKCKELNIEIFYLFEGKNKRNNLNQLSRLLGSLEKITSI